MQPHETKTQASQTQTGQAKTAAALTLLALVFALTGCISSQWMRLIPENKDSDVQIQTFYGTAIIRTRVNPQGSNYFAPLNNSAPFQP